MTERRDFEVGGTEAAFFPATHEEVDWRRIHRVVVVPFLAGGDVVLVEEHDRLAVPEGPVAPGEDPFRDAALRVPLATAGFRRQGTHIEGVSRDGHVALLWVDGARYQGDRPHRRDARWWTGPAAEAADLLRQQGDNALAEAVAHCNQARRTMTDERYLADSQRLLEPAYLGAGTAQGGSGFGGDATEWREARSMLCDAVDRDSTLLDVGCANGLLMESVVAWCAERGVRVEPYGVDLSAALVAVARRRLPHWADRIWVGNALEWVPPGGRRFDVVHTLLDVVPENRRGDLVAHLLATAVTPGGRLMVSQYGEPDPHWWAPAVLERLGYEVGGVTRRPTRHGRPQGSPSAWVVKPPPSE